MSVDNVRGTYCLLVHIVDKVKGAHHHLQGITRNLFSIRYDISSSTRITNSKCVMKLCFRKVKSMLLLSKLDETYQGA
jgi:hypothetical protein